jgi:hypothetical protein
LKNVKATGRILLIALLFLSVGIEYWPINFNIYYSLEFPADILEEIKMEKNTTVLNIPYFRRELWNTHGMYYQCFYWKPILDGTVSRIAKDSYLTLNKIAYVSENQDKYGLLDILSSLSTKFVIINKRIPPSSVENKTIQLIEKLHLDGKAKLIYDSTSLRIYKLQL